jgi:hypothetical protein
VALEDTWRDRPLHSATDYNAKGRSIADDAKKRHATDTVKYMAPSGSALKATCQETMPSTSTVIVNFAFFIWIWK